MSGAITAAVAGGVASAAAGSMMADDGGGGEATASNQPRLTPAQMKLVRKLSDQLHGQIGENVDPYTGDIVAGESGLQSQLFDLMKQSSSGRAGGMDLIRTLQRQGLDMAGQEYDPQQEQDYWRQAFVEPARHRFYEETMPQLREQFAGQNALSSSGFNRAVAREAGRMETDLASQLAQAVQQGKTLNLQERSVGLNTLDSALQQLDALSQAGQIQRGIEQGGLDEQLQKWQQQQPYNNPWLQYLDQTGISQAPYNTVVQQSQPGLLQGMAPGIASGIGRGVSSGVQSMFNNWGTGS